MAAKSLPDAKYLRQCFDYDPDTGVLTWRHRPDEHFASPTRAKQWNAKFVGREAGTGCASAPYRIVWLSVFGVQMKAPTHRIAFKLMTGRDPDPEVDHRNGDERDNRWSNLRESTRVQNACNQGPKNLASRKLPKGVVSYGPRSFWAFVMFKGVKVKRGRFDTPEEAHAAYCAEAARLHGEFFNGDGSIFA